MKNLDQLAIEAKVRKAIELTAQNYARFLGIHMDIIDVGEGYITVKTQQVQKTTDRVYEPKELVDKTKEAFSHLVDLSLQIRVRPLTFKGEGLEAVSADWVKNQLKKFNLNQADIVRDFGIDKSALSKLLNNETGFTRWHKAAFYFYFKAVANDQK